MAVCCFSASVGVVYNRIFVNLVFIARFAGISFNCLQTVMPKRRKNTNTSITVSNTMLNGSEKSNRKRSSLVALRSVSVEDHDYTCKELRKCTREKLIQAEGSEINGNGTFSYMKDADQSTGGSCKRKFISSDGGCKGINLMPSKPSMKSRCISQNAINARINRLKKKGYIQSLENKITNLMTQNEELKTHNEDQLKCINSLKVEVAYLRGVIGNMSEIRSLLRTVHHHSDLQMTSSLFKDPTSSCMGENQIKVDTGTCKENEQYNNITVSDTTRELPKFDETDTSINFYENLSCFDTLVDNDILNPFSVDGKFLESTSDVFNGNMEDGLFCINETQNSVDVPNVGVCFHIANKRISLEFCAVCSQNALS